jgi:chromosome segregation ATPase
VCAERDLAVWLHAEVQHRAEELADFAGEQANARRESDRVRNIAARECADLRDERDSARTALAEKTEYAGEKAREGDVMSLQIEDLTAERDELRTRIDTALAKLNRGGPFLPARQAAIAALQGDQSTPPETRCMNGPAKQRTLRMVEIIKALRAASTSGVLPDHLDERGSFAPMARAIVDHWPTGEADRG